MLKFKVVHFSPTPLVGAPSKIVQTLNNVGCDAKWIIKQDYPNKGPLFKKFSANAFNLSEISDLEKLFIEEFIKDADVIHIHNDITQELSEWFFSLNPEAKYIYQVHSPLHEGPLYVDRSDNINLPICSKLVVAQYQPRHYQNFRIVPNLVLDKPSINLRKKGEKLRVIFSPTHSRKGRWNSKYSEKLIKVLKSYNDVNLIDLVSIEQPINPSLLMELRKSCHVSIDEIITGAYHQVSLEGLCAGNVVLNFADFFSCSMLKNIAHSNELPPFLKVNEDNIESVILKLIMDNDYCNDLQVKSHNYFKKYLTAENMIKHFLKVYNA